jgi:hypothetical protein
MKDAGGGQGWFVTPKWENHGSTSAAQFLGWDNIKTFTPDADSSFDFMNLGRSFAGTPRLTIGPGSPVYQMSKFISVSDAVATHSGSARIVIWGYIEYADSLPGHKMHHVHWCFQATPIQARNALPFSFSAYRPECNSSDRSARQRRRK